jgi:hypothetical protein
MANLPLMIKNLEMTRNILINPSTILVDRLGDLKDKLELLTKILKSDTFPCPICSRRTRDTEKIGILTLSWDIEYDDYYPVSSEPVILGTCEDEITGFGIIRPHSPRYLGKQLPFNHAEQINEMMGDDMVCEEMAYILGAAQERRRICELLGIQVKTWGE